MISTAEIRQSFLDYFASKGHTIVPSSSLVPGDDPTLLFVNAGMVQFKDCFLGTDKRDYVRATTCQKCLRISGKHNDLENVGRTARHHTFFEMLGNFSFGDYFKRDAILYAWEYLTVTLQLPKDRLWVTIYEEDDEAGELWAELTDVPRERILKMGKEDNFWAMGETGPCGPCSEIHYFLGDDLKSQSEQDFRTSDGRYIEIWNLVFMQFNRDPSGKMTPLPKPSVDTGMGLERVAAVKQLARSNYDTDAFRKIITFTEKLSAKSYLGHDYTLRDPQADPQYGVDVAHRVIADHVRSSIFLIADGINPSSDGRGYVLRRLIRRACRHGRVLGFKAPFLHKVGGQAIELMKSVYPELAASAAKILKLIEAEEEKFLTTLDSGLGVLVKEVAATKAKNQRTVSGEVAFLLHDTYGFPLDLTEDIIRADSLIVDRDAFQRAMEQQRDRSRSARAGEAAQILQRAVKPTKSKFVGYEFGEYESKVSGLFDANGEIQSANEGQEIALVVEETPFYAESGGQVGDTGRISANGCLLDVLDTQKVGGDTIVHICKVVEGEIEIGHRVRLAIEEARRRRLRANHSATHLVHLALREVAGDHVKQAGSRVSDQSLRFDYSHFEALSPAQLAEIEGIVNEQIRANHEVITRILPIDEAKKTGAIALFGEKYGAMVRVVQIGPRSVELCGGTHVLRSGDIGVLTLTAESGISAGVRRIEAVAGTGAFDEIVRKRTVLNDLSALLKTSDRDLVERVKRLLDRQRELEREIERYSQSEQSAKGKSLSDRAVTTASGLKVVASVVERADAKQLREMADDLRAKLGSGCIALCSIVDGKAIVLTAVTDNLTEKYHAGNLATEMSKIMGGRGGGRADMAQAGGGDPSKIELALQRFQDLLS